MYINSIMPLRRVRECLFKKNNYPGQLIINDMNGNRRVSFTLWRFMLHL